MSTAPCNAAINNAETEIPSAHRAEPRHRPLSIPLTLALVAVFVAFGGHQAAIKLGNAEFAPLFQAGLRSIGATLLLTIWFALVGNTPWQSGARWWEAGLLGLLFTLDFALLFLGLDHTSATRGTILYYTAPVMMAGGTAIALRSERLGKAATTGLICAFLGTIVVLWRGDEAAGSLLGDILCLGAAAAWAGIVILIKVTRLVRIPAATALYFQLAGSAFALPALSLALGESWYFPLEPAPLLALGYQTIIVAFAGYLGFFWLVKHVPAATLSVFSFIAPLVGVTLGIAFFEEPMTAGFAIGVGLVLTGLYLVSRSGGGRAKSPARSSGTDSPS